ncbi:hypothetical protein ACU60U_04245 [Klebsiella aerogenes]
MERNELEEGRAAFIASEIAIGKDAIAAGLEAKCRALGNVIHKGLLRDAAEMVRKGK